MKILVIEMTIGSLRKRSRDKLIVSLPNLTRSCSRAVMSRTISLSTSPLLHCQWFDPLRQDGITSQHPIRVWRRYTHSRRNKRFLAGYLRCWNFLFDIQELGYQARYRYTTYGYPCRLSSRLNSDRRHRVNRFCTMHVRQQYGIVIVVTIFPDFSSRFGRTKEEVAKMHCL